MKYKLRLDLKLEVDSLTLYRIERLSDGILGGYIEKESNLSQYGTAWVHGDAKVYGNARVHGSARVYEAAQIYQDAQISGCAHISGNACVYGEARVHGNSYVSGDAKVHGSSWVSGEAHVLGNACISKVNHLLSIIFWAGFHITITPDNTAIGCQLKSRSEWLQISKEDATVMGLKEEYYDTYLELLKSGMKLVPDRKDIKE